MSFVQEEHGFFRRLLKKLGTLLKVYLIGVGIFWTAVPLLIVFLISGSVRKAYQEHQIAETPKVKSSPSILNIEFDGEVSDSIASSKEGYLSFLFSSDKTYYLLDLEGRLKEAAADPFIEGLFLDFKNLSGSKNQLREIRESIADFKAKGKKVWCWVPSLDSDLFIVASVCDQLDMSPAGNIELLGPYFSLMYFGEALKKLGVGIEVIRSGPFKNAFEPLVSNEPSPETLQMYRWLEGDLRSTLVEEIAKSAREGLDEAKVKSWFKKSLYTGIEAKTLGIVSDLRQKAETKKLFEEQLAKKELNWLDYQDYRSRDTSWNVLDSRKKEIAYLHLSGEIDYSEGNSRDHKIVPDWVAEDLNWAVERDSVAAIVIRMDSPGGSALASEMIWGMVHEAGLKKPVVVSIGGVGASGGYYIASAAKKIVADPFSITGSIGVIGMVPNFAQFQEKYGVSFFEVTSSDRKTIGNRGKLLSEEDRKLISQGIDETYELFLKRVSEGRSLTRNAVHEIAQGKVWTGRQALDLKLVDRLGGIKEAIKEAKGLAGLDQDKPLPVVSPNSEFSLTECLLDKEDLRECFAKNSRASLGFKAKISEIFLPSELQTALSSHKARELSSLSSRFISKSSLNGPSKSPLIETQLYGVELK
ncbi:MAG: signal peptide peptidase SppA [Pseudomonadota bacterium]